MWSKKGLWCHILLQGTVGTDKYKEMSKQIMRRPGSLSTERICHDKESSAFHCSDISCKNRLLLPRRSATILSRSLCINLEAIKESTSRSFENSQDVKVIIYTHLIVLASGQDTSNVDLFQQMADGPLLSRSKQRPRLCSVPLSWWRHQMETFSA